MLGRRRRRWPNIDTAFGLCFLFAVMPQQCHCFLFGIHCSCTLASLLYHYQCLSGMKPCITLTPADNQEHVGLCCCQHSYIFVLRNTVSTSNKTNDSGWPGCVLLARFKKYYVTPFTFFIHSVKPHGNARCTNFKFMGNVPYIVETVTYVRDYTISNTDN